LIDDGFEAADSARVGAASVQGGASASSKCSSISKNCYECLDETGKFQEWFLTNNIIGFSSRFAKPGTRLRSTVII
jgi:hypothetical protein